MKAFSPIGNTVNAAVTATTAALAITEGGDTVLVTNVGSLTIFIKFGDSTVTAALATSTPVLPNSAQTFRRGIAQLAQYIAVISTATGNTVYVTTGEGI